MGTNYYATMHYFETGLGQRVALAVAGSPERAKELLEEALDPFFKEFIATPIEGLPKTGYLPVAIRTLAEKYPGVVEHLQETQYNLS